MLISKMASQKHKIQHWEETSATISLNMSTAWGVPSERDEDCSSRLIYSPFNLVRNSEKQIESNWILLLGRKKIVLTLLLPERKF